MLSSLNLHVVHHFKHGKLKMTIFQGNLNFKFPAIFIYLSLINKRHVAGCVAGNQAWLHTTEIAQPSRRALHRALHSVAHNYLRATCLFRRSCTKKKALDIFFFNVNIA